MYICVDFTQNMRLYRLILPSIILGPLKHPLDFSPAAKQTQSLLCVGVSAPYHGGSIMQRACRATHCVEIRVLHLLCL